MMFDCNAHPTIDGTWLDGRSGCDFAESERRLRAAGFQGACAVALPQIGGYSPDAFARAAAGDFWIPIAAWTDNDIANADLPRDMQRLRRSGYRGVKIHPRLLHRLYGPAELGRLIASAADADLRVLICTYPFGAPQTGLAGNLLEVLSAALQYSPDAAVMLLHAGCIDLLRYIEFARVHPAILLDVSFTLIKYEGSSLDADLRFAFRNFDRRIALGTDYPECDPVAVRQRFETICREADIAPAKRNNMASSNARRFFGLAP